MNDFKDPEGAQRRRGTDPMFEVLSHDVRRMREDMQEMKGGIVKMTDALNKLVLIEERQSAQGAALERAFGEIAKLQARADDDADRHNDRVESAIGEVKASVQRLHNRYLRFAAARATGGDPESAVTQ